MEKTWKETFFDQYEPDMPNEGTVSLTGNQVWFDEGITDMFSRIGAKAVRISRPDPDPLETIQIQPAKPTEAGALKLNYRGTLSFINFDIGDREGFELSADYYPTTIPQDGLRLDAMFDQLWDNHVRIARQALAAA